MKHLIWIVIGTVWVVGGHEVTAAPEPELAPRSWQFEFEAAVPRPIAVQDVDGQFRWYWFVAYKVVNRTGRDNQFLPKITIATDQGDIVEANRHVPTRVFAAIKQQLGNRLLASPIKVVGKLNQGPDHGKESVAIWPAFARDVDAVDIFVSGLSGETAQVLDPRTGEPVMDPASLKPLTDPRSGGPVLDATGKPLIKPRPLLLRKTLMIHYQMPGTDVQPGRQTIVPSARRWVMR